MYSAFSAEFTKVMHECDYDQTAIDYVKHLVLVWEWESRDVACEACRWLGDTEHWSYSSIITDYFLKHKESETRRRLALEYILLNSHSVAVRDSAGLGLASIDDPASLPALYESIAKEPSDEIKEMNQMVIDQLLETQQKIQEKQNAANDTD